MGNRWNLRQVESTARYDRTRPKGRIFTIIYGDGHTRESHHEHGDMARGRALHASCKMSSPAIIPAHWKRTVCVTKTVFAMAWLKKSLAQVNDSTRGGVIRSPSEGIELTAEAAEIQQGEDWTRAAAPW